MTTTSERPLAPTAAPVVGEVARGRRRRARQRRTAAVLLAVVAVGLFAPSLMVGTTFYGPSDVVSVITGETVPGASFTVGVLRLPRAMVAVLAGAALGLGGVTFQTTLRNPLAAPDVIGISSGASAAAVIAIVVLELPSPQVSALAIAGALVTAAVI